MRKTIPFFLILIFLMSFSFVAIADKNEGKIAEKNQTEFSRKIIDVDSLINQKHVAELKAEIKFKKLLTFEEFSRLHGSKNLPDNILPKDKVVWVIEGFFPRIDHPRQGTMENVNVTSVFDAETGEVIGNIYSKVN